MGISDMLFEAHRSLTELIEHPRTLTVNEVNALTTCANYLQAMLLKYDGMPCQHVTIIEADAPTEEKVKAIRNVIANRERLAVLTERLNWD